VLAAKVRAAARAEVAARGATDVTLASIARRAKVAKSTVYLRWENVLDLLAEALIDIVDFGDSPDSGSLKTDLVILAKQVIDASMTTPMLELHMQFFAMGARAPATYRRFQENDMALGVERGRKVFEQAITRGDIPADIDLDIATSAFMGALLMQALTSPTHNPPDSRAINAITDLFVEGLLHKH
jgi:AcrR family transcriptional regulator